MSKNIVICCDGTRNQFGLNNTNIVKLYQTLEESDLQATYYHPGLGTLGARAALTKTAKFVTRKLGEAFGFGLSDDLTTAYLFLMNEYNPGDKIFMFGFSRGA